MQTTTNNGDRLSRDELIQQLAETIAEDIDAALLSHGIHDQHLTSQQHDAIWDICYDKAEVQIAEMEVCGREAHSESQRYDEMERRP